GIGIVRHPYPMDVRGGEIVGRAGAELPGARLVSAPLHVAGSLANRRRSLLGRTRLHTCGRRTAVLLRRIDDRLDNRAEQPKPRIPRHISQPSVSVEVRAFRRDMQRRYFLRYPPSSMPPPKTEV